MPDRSDTIGINIRCFILSLPDVSVMDMPTRVMNTMVQDAPAKTTQRPPPVSAALRVTGKTATGNRYKYIVIGYLKVECFLVFMK